MKDYYEKSFSKGFTEANSKSNLAAQSNGIPSGRHGGTQTNDMFIPNQSAGNAATKKTKAQQQNIQMQYMSGQNFATNFNIQPVLGMNGAVQTHGIQNIQKQKQFQPLGSYDKNQKKVYNVVGMASRGKSRSSKGSQMKHPSDQGSVYAQAISQSIMVQNQILNKQQVQRSATGISIGDPNSVKQKTSTKFNLPSEVNKPGSRGTFSGINANQKDDQKNQQLQKSVLTKNRIPSGQIQNQPILTKDGDPHQMSQNGTPFSQYVQRVTNSNSHEDQVPMQLAASGSIEQQSQKGMSKTLVVNPQQYQQKGGVLVQHGSMDMQNRRSAHQQMSENKQKAENGDVHLPALVQHSNSKQNSIEPNMSQQQPRNLLMATGQLRNPNQQQNLKGSAQELASATSHKEVGYSMQKRQNQGVKEVKRKTGKKVNGKNTSHGLNRLNTDNPQTFMAATASHYYEHSQYPSAYTNDRFAKDYHRSQINTSQKQGSTYHDNIVTRKNVNAYGMSGNQLLSPKTKVKPQSAEQAPAKKVVMLSDQEKQQYGNRCPAGFKKQNILGKGGIAIVWLATDLATGTQVAMKQFPKTGGKFDSSAGVEIQIQQVIANKMAQGVKGGENLCRLLKYCEDKKDCWLIYEVCQGQTMNEALFNVKGEFYKGERIYLVHHSNLYHAIRNNNKLMVDFLSRMTSVLNLFHQAGVVHADLKPDNILVDYDEQTQTIKSMKIIDLGSSFLLNSEETKLKDQVEFGQSTPEYLPPEIQLYLTRKFTQQNNYQISDFSEIAFVFDVWSLGSILLEIISGFPLWLSLKSRVKSLDNRSIINYGIFGVSGRDNNKILQKQNLIFGQQGGISKLKQSLKKGYDYTGNQLMDNPLFNKLLAGLLEFDPERRMSPQEIMDCEYLNS